MCAQVDALEILEKTETKTPGLITERTFEILSKRMTVNRRFEDVSTLYGTRT